MKSILVITVKGFAFFSACFFCFNLVFLFFDRDMYVEAIIYPSIFLTITLTVIHVVLARKEGVKHDFSAVQNVKINLHLQLSEIIDRIQEKSNWKLIKQDNNNLVYKSNFSTLKSYGEIITISLSNNEVLISSKSVLITTIFDFGKNYENVKLIKSLI